MSCITAKDIREFIQDRTAEDNDLELDLTFTDEEIADAMVRSAREYNSVPPFIGTVDPKFLPGDTNVFLDGTAQHLYLSRFSRLTRSDIDYTAGGVSVNLVAKQVSYLRELIKLHGERFQSAVKPIKLAINLSRAYRHM